MKKIADIVKYEARQQIPFALEDVIWDYQRMAGRPGGRWLRARYGDRPVRDEARASRQGARRRTTRPSIEVDIIQLAPIAIYNYVAHDVAKELPEGQEYNSESPPPSLVVLSIGTDTTDLVVTNGYPRLAAQYSARRQSLHEAALEGAEADVRQGRAPEAESEAGGRSQGDLPGDAAGLCRHGDRSAAFDRLLPEPRSQGEDRQRGDARQHGQAAGPDAVSGEAPGLRSQGDRLVQQALGRPRSSRRRASRTTCWRFATCYGLCLQGLDKGKLSTNLLPREILTQRMIKAKKPWAVAGVSALVLGFALSYVFYYQVWNQVHDDKMVQGVTWKKAVEEAKNVSTRSTTLIGEDKKKQSELALIQRIGQEVAGGTDRRVMWMEVLKAINSSLPPMDPTGKIVKPGDPPPDPQKLPFVKRQDLKVEYIESQFYPDLSVWFSNEVKRKYLELNSQLVGGAATAPGSAAPSATNATPPAAGTPASTPPSSTPPSSTPPSAAGSTPPGVPSSTPPGAGNVPPGAAGVPSSSMPGSTGGGGAAPAASQADVSGVALEGPKGPGWVIEIKGHHFFNDPANRRAAGPAHLRNTLLRNLEQGWIDVPAGPGRPPERFTHKELGIGFAILALDPPIREFIIPNPNAEPMTSDGSSGSAFGGPMDFGGGAKLPGKADAKEDPNNPPVYKVPRYDFIVQFCWQEKPLGIRLAERELKRKELEALQAANPAAPAAPPPAGTPATVAPGVPAVAIPPATATPTTPAPIEGVAPPPVDPAAPLPPATEPAAEAPPMPAIPAVPEAAPPATPPAAPVLPEAPAEAPAAAPVPNTP